MSGPRTRSTGPEVDQAVGQRVKKHRTERGWDFLQLHREIEAATKDDPWGPTVISPAVLKNCEEGMIVGHGRRQVRRITTGEVRGMALAFGITTDDLIFGYSL